MASDLAGKVKAAVQKRPKIVDTPAGEAARARVQDALGRLRKSPVAGSPIGQAFQDFLQHRLSSGQDLDDLLEEAKGAAERELARRRHVVSFLSSAANLFRTGDRLVRVRREVIQPAGTRQVSGPQAWDRMGRILSTPYPFLTWVESHVGKLTVGAALQASAGLGAGLGKAYGISGIRHGMACFFEQDSVCVGAVAGADFGGQLSVAPGTPAPGLSYTLEVALGGGYGATGSVSVALIPTPHKPTVQEAWLFDYEFAGLAVSLGGGGGLNLSLGLGLTRSVVLQGGRLSEPAGLRA